MIMQPMMSILETLPSMVQMDASQLKKAKKAKKKVCEHEEVNWYPGDETMLEAQRSDPEVSAGA
jgi:hypothetical protein